MSISVIIPTFKRSNDLNRLFDSLTYQVLKPNEILVVIGPGDKDSIAVAKKWSSKLPEMQVIECKKPSVVHSLNTGLSSASGTIICLIDDDVWLPPDWALKISNAYKANSNLGAYGGRDHLQLSNEPHLSDPPLALTVGMFQWNGSLIGNHHCGSVNSPVGVDVLKGVNLSFRRDALPGMQIEQGLEGHGAETCWEVDICQRVKLAGYEVVYDNNNNVLHYASPRLNTDNRTDLFSPAWNGRLFNESLVIAKFRDSKELFFYSMRTLLVGYRLQPGLVWSVLLLPKYGVNVLKIPFSNARYLVKGIKFGFKRRRDLAVTIS